MPILTLIAVLVAFFLPKMEGVFGHTADEASSPQAHQCCAHEEATECTTAVIDEDVSSGEEKNSSCCGEEASCECDCWCHFKLPPYAQPLTSFLWFAIPLESETYLFAEQWESILFHPPSPPPKLV